MSYDRTSNLTDKETKKQRLLLYLDRNIQNLCKLRVVILQFKHQEQSILQFKHQEQSILQFKHQEQSILQFKY